MNQVVIVLTNVTDIVLAVGLKLIRAVIAWFVGQVD